MAGKRKNPATGLSDMEEAFCREYLVDANQTQAAIRAGYSEKTANAQAVEIMKRPEVRAKIDLLIADRAERTKLTAYEVIENIRRISAKAEQDDDYAAALRGNELLGKHLKIFTEKHEVTGKDGGPIQLSDHEAAAKLAAILNAARSRKGSAEQ